MPAFSPGEAAADASPNAVADLAPRWHTALLITLIVLVALLGTWLAHRGVAVQISAAPPSKSALYLQLGIVSVCLLIYVCRVGRRKNALLQLLGRGWTRFGRALGDVLLAASGWLAIKGCEFAAQRLFASTNSAAVVALLPHSSGEKLAWAAVALGVGFCEEVVYRGYLQTQLRAFTGRAGLAIVLQALLFGLAHGEQGPGAMARIALYGFALGLLAHFRNSLWPGILLHAFTNLASGLLRA